MTERRVRVMQVLECGGPGGTGYQVAALCNGLDRTRFATTLAYAVRPGSTPADYERLASGAERFIHVPEMVREISPVSDLRALWRLYRIFRQDRPDIIHAHSSKAGFLARAAGWAAGIGCILYSPRGYAFLQQDRSFFLRWLFRTLERSVSWIGEIIAVSDSEGELARTQAWASRVRVVRDAFLGTLPDAPPGKPATGTGVLVCTCGRISYPRYPEAFLTLAHRLAQVRPDVRFLWIGDGELRQVVDAWIDRFGLKDRFAVTGWLPQSRAIETLRSSDILVHYSRWEGLPNAVIDAMANGLPVVASDIPGNQDLVQPGVNGFLAGDDVALFGRTLQLVDDPPLRRRMGAQGHALIRREFGLDRLLREISQTYSSPRP